MPLAPEFKFRFADASDASAIVAVIERAYRGEESKQGWTNEDHLFDGPRTNTAEVEALIADRDSRFVLALDGAAIAGCALVRNQNGTGYFGLFAVRPGLQGTGLGRTIMVEAERAIRDLWRCSAIVMTVINLRTDLIAYYQRRGYRLTGEQLPFPTDQAAVATRDDFHLVVLRKDLAGTYKFRIAVPSDAQALTSFVNATYHGPEAAKGWTPETHLHGGPRTNVERVAAHIADAEARFILCEDANGLLGCALIEHKGDGAYFGMFAVRTARQDGGIGRAIFAEAERLARALWQCHFMTLTVINLQTDLTAYYKRRGYHPTGERQPFPFDEAPAPYATTTT